LRLPARACPGQADPRSQPEALCRAVQTPCRTPSSYSETPVSGHEPAGVRGSIKAARQPDRLVHRRGHRGVAGRTANDARRAAPLFAPGDHHGANDAHGLRSGMRQTEGLIGSVVALLGLALAVPDHSTLSRRSKTLDVPPLRRLAAGPLHLLVDSTGLKLGGAGEWLVEKHGMSRRRSWRKLHIGIDGESGEIVAIELTKKESDDGGRTAALLDQLTDPLASFTADGAYDQDRVYETVAERHPDAAVIVPPRATAVPGPSAATAPTQRDRHIQEIAAHGRMGWQKSSGFGPRSRQQSVDTNA